MTRSLFMIIAAGTATAASGQMSALSEVQFDVNSITVQAFDDQGMAGAFGGISHTGSIVLGLDSDSFMQAFADGSGLASLARGGPFGQFSLSGTIELVAGQVSGGSFSISIDDGADSYTTQIEAGSGRVRSVADAQGNSFQVDGLTFAGMFSDSVYGDLDVSAFTAIQPFNGNFINFDYRPDANGLDSLADLDVFTVIPSPGSVAMLSMIAAGIGTRRRR